MLNKLGTQKERSTFELVETTNLIWGPSKCKVSTEPCSEKASASFPTYEITFVLIYYVYIHDIFVYLGNKKNF